MTLVPSGKVRFCDITGIVSLEMECEAIRYGHTKKKGNINNKNLQNPCELRKISSRVILVSRILQWFVRLRAHRERAG